MLKQGSKPTSQNSRGIFTERTWTRELPSLHYVMGAIFFILAFLNNYSDPDGVFHVVDFWVYYRAAVISHLMPENLYNDAYYNYPLPNSGGVEHIYEFMNPPTFIPWIYPLGFFTSRMAITLWTTFNLFLTFILYRNISLLSKDIPSAGYRAILKSLVFGIYAWSWCIYNGQVSVILALAISFFLRAWKDGRPEKSMFWLAIGLCVKPHYFIPVAFFLAGNRKYRCVFAIAKWVILFALLGTIVDGPRLWVAFAEQVFSHGKINLYYIMVNFRGILFLFTPHYLAGKIVALCSLLYIVTAMCAFVAGHRQHQTGTPLSLETLCFWIIAAMYFCPWMHQHDFYLLLPLITFLMPKLIYYGKHIPFLVSYCLVLPDFLVPDMSIMDDRITMSFAFVFTLLLLRDMTRERKNLSTATI